MTGRTVILYGAIGLLGIVLGWQWKRERPGTPNVPTSERNSLRLERQSQVSQGTQARIKAVHQAGSISEQCALGLSLAKIAPPEDWDNLLKMTDQLPSHTVRDLVRRHLIERWMEQSPPDALEWSLNHERQFAGLLTKQWYERDPDQAMAFVNAWPWDRDRMSLLEGVASVLIEQDFDGALTFIRTWSKPRQSYFRSVILKLAAQDPQRLIERQEDLPDGVNWEADLLRVWARQDTNAAYDWVLANGSNKTLVSFMRLLEDPQVGLEMLAKMSPEQQATASGNLQFTRRLPEEVLRLLKDYPDLTESTRATIREKAEKVLGPPKYDAREIPQSPEEIAQSLVESSYLRNGVLKSANVEALVEAIDELPKDQSIDARINFVDVTRQANQFELAASQLAHLPDTHKKVIEEVAQVGAQWALADPVAASTWVATLPPGQRRQWAAFNVRQQWARLDPAAAESWFTELGVPLPDLHGVPMP